MSVEQVAEAAVVRPGETLVLRFSASDRPLNAQDAHMIKLRAESVLPEGARVLIVQSDEMLVESP